MSCEEVIALLADYLDAALGDDGLAALAAHLEGCDGCQAYLATYRKTRSLAAVAGRVDIPPELQRRIAEFLLARLARIREG